jgi:hypothetical protein
MIAFAAGGSLIRQEALSPGCGCCAVKHRFRSEQSARFRDFCMQAEADTEPGSQNEPSRFSGDPLPADARLARVCRRDEMLHSV